MKKISQINQLNPQGLEYLDYPYNIKPDMKKKKNAVTIIVTKSKG